MGETFRNLFANKANSSLFLVCLVVFFDFLFLNICTPEFLDDFLYKFCFIDGDANKNYPIRNVSDIFVSQVEHYRIFNGRSIIHFLVQLFTGLLGKSVFNAVNSIVFVGFVALLVKLANIRLSEITFPIVAIASVLLMPSFESCFLWMTGTMNYLWSSCAALLFLYIVDKWKDRAITAKYCLMGVLGLLLGWTHEGISFPLALSAVCYIIFVNKQKVRSAAFPIIAFFLIGALLCAFAPGTMSRGGFNSSLTVMAIVSKVLNGFVLLCKLKSFGFFVLLLIYCAIRKIRIRMMDGINPIVIGGILFSLGVVFAAGFSAARAAFGLELCCLVMSLKLLSEIGVSKVVRYTILSLGLLFVISLTAYSYGNMKVSQRLLSDVKTTTDGIIVYDEQKVPQYLESYIQRPLTPSYSEYYMCYSQDYWENEYIAATYGKERLTFLPSEFINNVKRDKNAYSEFDVNSKLPFYCKKLSSVESVKGVKFLLRKCTEEDIQFYYRPFANRLERFLATSIESDKWAVQEVYGERYLMITKNAMIDNRLIGIEIIH